MTLPQHNFPLPIGSTAPDFSLPQGSGAESRLSLHELRGQPVILAFWPPEWNPAREAHLRAFNDLLASSQPHGATLIGIETDGIWCDLDLRGESGGERLRFPLLRDFDPQGEVARAFGVYGERALFVLDGQGVVLWNCVLPPGVPPRATDVLQALHALSPNGPDEDALEAPPGEPPAAEPQVLATRRQFLATALAASLALSAASLSDSAAAAHAQEIGSRTTGSLYPGNRVASPPGSGARLMTLQINGARHRLELEPRVTLLDALREHIGLNGTKKGCNHGQCGACTVLVNGERVNSCLTLAMQVEGDQITTIEGVARGQELHPVQAAFIEHDGFQCGYCTPGQVCSAVALLREVGEGRLSAVTPREVVQSGVRPQLTDEEIRERMSGNLCRCGAYNGIVAAVRQAAGKNTTTS